MVAVRAQAQERVGQARAYWPAVALTAGSVALVAAGWALHWGGMSFTGASTALRAVLAGPATLLMLGVFLVVERVWPAQQRSPFARGYRQDLLYALLHATIFVPFMTALTLATVALVLDVVSPLLAVISLSVIPVALRVTRRRHASMP